MNCVEIGDQMRDFYNSRRGDWRNGSRSRLSHMSDNGRGDADDASAIVDANGEVNITTDKSQTRSM